MANITRAQLIQQLRLPKRYDLAVIGGGATGLGIALQASLRGYSVVLLEAHDFAKGSSSRSTKLAHGGVRYLARGEIGMVRKALQGRAGLLEDIPHLAQAICFVVPSYNWLGIGFYGLGLKLYEWLAGSRGLGKTGYLNAKAVLAHLPGLKADGLRGGVKYIDGQFDDARFAINLARTAQKAGALLVNYCRVENFNYQAGKINGLLCTDAESAETFSIQAACVINATGVWVDTLCQQDALFSNEKVSDLINASQGVHLVVDKDFLPSEHALLIPDTRDKRMLFAIPWLGKIILGTTDTPRTDMPQEPLAYEQEISFILAEAARYLTRPPKRSDVRSVWVGLRPLVMKNKHQQVATGKLSRDHFIGLSSTGLLTVTGGKWTTYKAMAEDVLLHGIKSKLLHPEKISVDTAVTFMGCAQTGKPSVSLTLPQGIHLYGDEESSVNSLPGAEHWLLPGFSEAMVRFAARYEFARTVEDVLARRSRWLFLDSKLALSVAAEVADILIDEGVSNAQLQEFQSLALKYLPAPLSSDPDNYETAVSSLPG